MRILALLLIGLSSFSLASYGASTSLFGTSDLCATCHSSDSTTMIDSNGTSLSVYHDWGSTMMGNALRDPLFKAKVESEVSRNPHLKLVIEDKCTTCHAPMARTQAHWDGKQHYSMSDALNSDMARDSVSCTLCHQIQSGNLGTRESLSGGYSIDNSRLIVGPYTDVFANPMVNQLNYRPVFGGQVHESEMCATCHTLFTPYVDDAGEVAGTFPEQTPYLEWLNSEYSLEGEGHKSCQECHMPRVDEQIKITRRPPSFRETQSPFWKHHFVGGNVFVLGLLRDNAAELGAVASTTQFNKTIERTETQLGDATATLKVVSVGREPDKVAVTLSVRNLTGHKLPTGFPSRRVWIRLRATDASGKTLIDSGAWDNAYEVIGLDDGFEPHHDLIDSSEDVQIYQAIMGDVNGNITYTLLRAAEYLKDNRLPPLGFQSDGPESERTSVCGAASHDENFNRNPGGEGTGADLVVYEIPIAAVSWPIQVQATLLFQNPAPRFVRDLPTEGAATERFKSLYNEAQNSPTVLASLSFAVPTASANLDSSGYVDFFDFAFLAAHWLDPDCDQCSDGDLHVDGIVDYSDLTELVAEWLEY